MPNDYSPGQLALAWWRCNATIIPLRDKRPTKGRGPRHPAKSVSEFNPLVRDKLGRLVPSHVDGVGVMPGSVGCLVVDVDVHGGDGYASLASLENEHGPLDRRWSVVTPSGGLHIWYRRPRGLRVPNLRLASGIDLCGDDRYVRVYDFPPILAWPVAPRWLCERIGAMAHALEASRPVAADLGANAVPSEDWAPSVNRALAKFSLANRNRSAHSAATALTRLASMGVIGAADALAELRRRFIAAGKSEREWERIAASAARIVASTPSSVLADREADRRWTGLG